MRGRERKIDVTNEETKKGRDAHLSKSAGVLVLPNNHIALDAKGMYHVRTVMATVSVAGMRPTTWCSGL